MRVLKDDKYEAILCAARREFAVKGYRDASMRTISADAGVGLSNIYNYFHGKDDIYVAVVGPAVEEVFALISSWYPWPSGQPCRGGCEGMAQAGADLVESRRDELRLLFHGSEGSSADGFRTVFAERLARSICGWSDKRRASDLFVNMFAAWIVDAVDEMTARNMGRQEICNVFREFFRFGLAGWREVSGD